MNRNPPTTQSDVQSNPSITAKMILRFLLVMSFCLSAVVVAHADPLTLTSGSFTTFTSPGFWHDLGSASGPNVSFSGGASNNCDIGPCPNPNILSSLLTPIGSGGTLAINGVTYDAFRISFGFTDTTTSGLITVFSDRNPLIATPLFSMDFVGQGFVTVSENPEFRSTLTVFTITNPTPEPASLFLIGLGVTGLAVKLKTSRRKRAGV